MFDRLRYPALLFFGASLLGLLLVQFLFGGSLLGISLSAVGFGFGLGFVVQFLVRQSLPKLRIGVASFCGAFTLWLPVVFVTYGFALMATPLFIGFAAAVVLGTVACRRMHRVRTIPS